MHGRDALVLIVATIGALSAGALSMAVVLLGLWWL